MTQPNNIIHFDSFTMDKDHYNLIKKLHDETNEILTIFAKENKLQVIDLAQLMNNRDEYFYDAYHYNDEGSKIIAKTIFNHAKDFND